jgi:hypothetical protein
MMRMPVNAGGTGVGVCVGVAVSVGVDVAVGVAVGVGVKVAVAVAVGVYVAVADGVSVGARVGSAAVRSQAVTSHTTSNSSEPTQNVRRWVIIQRT